MVEAQSGLSQGSDRGAVALSINAQAEQRSTGLRHGWLWSRLTAAVSTAAAVTGARNTELGCRQGQRHWRFSRARCELRQWQGQRRQRLGAQGRQRQEEGMKSVNVKHPFPSSYRTSRGSRRVHLLAFSLF